MKRYRNIPASLFVIILLAAFLSSAGRGAEAAVQGPLDLIRHTVEEARLIFNDSSLNQEQKINKLREIAEERFDFEEMSRRALASEWRKLLPGQRKEFVSLFSRLIEDVYSNKVKRYEKEIKEQVQDKVSYIGERVDSPYATVRTNIMTTTGAQVSVDYRLIEKKRQWRVYDVIVEGVSLINNYRIQFRDIISSRSYDDLLRRLKDKVGR